MKEKGDKSEQKAPRKKSKVETAMHGAEEEDFPRGAREAYIAPVERKRIRKEAEAEAFDSIETGSHLKKRTRKKSKGSSHDIDEDDFFKSLSSMEKLPKFVELLKFKMVSAGMLLWGMITEIRSTEMTVSLPHGLSGRVILENASDHIPKGQALKRSGKDSIHLNEYFVLGSYVRCSVVKVWGQENGKKKIDLSTKVSLVNKGLRREAVCDGACLSGCVKSVEDHGYIIDFGIANTQGFLSNDLAAKKYCQGSIIDVAVMTVKHGKNAIVTALSKDVDQCVTLEWTGVDINSLVPGSLVNIKVRNILSDGLLASFLTFFTGTVDPFHVGKALSEWKEGDKAKARILYCDHQTKAIGLSLLPHLLQKVMPILPSRGDIFESAIVKRVDPGLGIALQLPAPGEKELESYQAYAHISNLSDDKIEDIKSRFKPGQIVKCRVIGLRPIDGLASVSLKPTVVEGNLLDIGEIKPGMKITGIIDKVDDVSMLLTLSPHLKAAVPALHYSDTVHKRSHKKFKVGQTVTGKVLEINPEKRKIVITLKKSLVESKYPIIASIQDAVAGMRSHGVITGVREYGIFVTFFDGMSGLIGTDHLGLKSSQDLQEVFNIGQVVKARVMGANMKSQRLRLTLLSKQQISDLAAQNDTLRHFHVGQLVQGTIKKVFKDKKDDDVVTGYVLTLDSPGKSESLGRLDVGHLADHPSACSTLQESLTVGTVLKDLVILEKLDKSQQIKLSNKNSLREAVISGNIAKNLEDLRTGTVVPGFVASVLPDAIFVRFFDHLTGRARLNQISDSVVADPSSIFQVNMSVRAFISQVDLEKKQVTVSLKQSMCSDMSGSYIKSLFKDLELCHSLDDEDSIDWQAAFPYGSQADVTVHSIKEYGILCDFEEHPDVVGLVAHDQIISTQNICEGTQLSVTILDINKKDGIVDLSALEEVKEGLAETEKQGSVSIGDVVDVVVIQVKNDEGYCIVSLPTDRYPKIGYTCIKDYNDTMVKHCATRETFKARVVAMPSEDTGNRLIMVPEVTKKGKNSKNRNLPDRGSNVEIKIDAVHSLHADVTIEETQLKGKLHISQTKQKNGDSDENPLRSVIPGSKHTAFVIGISGQKSSKTPMVNVSLQSAEPLEWKNLEKGQTLTGYVQEIKDGHIWITYSPFVKGRAFIPDMYDTLEQCSKASSVYRVGSRVVTSVLSVDQEKHSLEVCIAREKDEVLQKSLKPGTLVVGYITAVNGRGIGIKIGWDKIGHVNLTDIFSVAVKNVLQSIRPGSFVQASIVSTKGKSYNLSLRKSSGAISGINEDSLDVINDVQVPKPSLKISELSPGSLVSGYVKVASKMGVFVTISRDLEARIKLRQLHDDFVEDPLQAYPPGSFVQGKVMAINDGKIDVTLRTRKTTMNVEGYEEGQIVKGKVKRIEKFGVFVTINDSPLTGLAHMSELCDGYVQNVNSLFKVGEDVRARVIKVDKTAGKISLGLKPSYFELGDESDDEVMGIDDTDEEDLDQQLLGGANDVLDSDSDDDDLDEEEDLEEDEAEDMEDIDQAMLDT